MSRAVVYSETGGPEVLRLVEKPVRAPAEGDVRVRMYRAGVNPTDWKSRRGEGRPASVDPPQVPGQDGAGEVDAIGEGVDTVLSGLRVWVWEAAFERPEGTAQEYAIVPARNVVPMRDSVSSDLGASVGVPFMTAHRCLTVAEEGPRRLGPGALTDRVVLVAGGAGAVGNAAIQLARWSDATVIATVSSAAKAQHAASAGADHVVNYREQDVAAEVGRITARGVDTIVEVSAATNAALDAAVLAQHGVVAVYADNGGSQLTVPIRTLMVPNARWQFVLLYFAPTEAKRQAVEDISAALDEGAIHAGLDAGLPLHHFPLDQAADAHAAVENGAVGKVLIDVAEPDQRHHV